MLVTLGLTWCLTLLRGPLQCLQHGRCAPEPMGFVQNRLLHEEGEAVPSAAALPRYFA